MKNSLVVFILFFISLFNFSTGWASWEQESQRIDFLIESIAQLPAVFIRNGTEHTTKEAAEHLRSKLENAQKSWFAPKKEKWTAEMFIEKVASRSSLSGKPYLIKYSDGQTITAKEYLQKQLKKYDEMTEDEESPQAERMIPLQIFKVSWPDFIDFKQVTYKWKTIYWDFFERGSLLDFYKKTVDFKNQSFQEEITPFVTDGCSSFPDGTVEYPELWKSCCVKHDIQYWMGGSKSLRILADDELKSCVKESVSQIKDSSKITSKVLNIMADLMKSGVAIGGSPWFYTPWRWGYGWNYPIQYQGLTEAQVLSVERRLSQRQDATGSFYMVY